MKIILLISFIFLTLNACHSNSSTKQILQEKLTLVSKAPSAPLSENSSLPLVEKKRDPFQVYVPPSVKPSELGSKNIKKTGNPKVVGLGFFNNQAFALIRMEDGSLATVAEGDTLGGSSGVITHIAPGVLTIKEAHSNKLWQLPFAPSSSLKNAQNISLYLENVPLHHALQLLSRMTGLSIEEPEPLLAPHTTVRLDNLSVKQSLDKILSPHQMDYEDKGTSIRLKPAVPGDSSSGDPDKIITTP